MTRVSDHLTRAATSARALRGVPRLDDTVDDRQPLVERQERRFHRVDREPAQVVEVVAESLAQGVHLRGHRGLAHQPVVGVDRDPEAERGEEPDRVLGDRRGGTRLHVGRRGELEGDPLVPHVRREPAEVGHAVVVHGDVVDDPDPVPEPVGAAPLDRLPDRRQAEGLTGVDGEMEVLPLEVLERVEVAGRGEARLGPGDVEADDPGVAPLHGELGDLARPRLVPHRGEELAYDDPAARVDHPLLEAGPHRGHDLVEAEPGGDVLLGGVANLGVDHAVGRQVGDALAGHPLDSSLGLHHRDRVVEGLEIPHQGAGVRRLREPPAEAVGIARGEDVTDLVGELEHRRRA